MKNLKLETGIGSLQWFVFLLVNSITLPIIIGEVYQLSMTETSELMQRTFFVVGIASLLAGWLGHRLPIPEGPAGIWLGIFVLMGQMAAAQGIEQTAALQLLQGGMLTAGAILIIMSATGWINSMMKLFTPLVNGVYLMMLGLQLSGVFLNGMMGVTNNSTEVHMGNIMIAFSVFFIVLGLSIWGKGWLKSYNVLIGIVIGCILFFLTNGTEPIPESSSLLLLPNLFAWGLPQLNIGMIVSSIIAGFVLVPNVIASVSAMQQVLKENKQNNKEMNENGQIKRAGITSGISSMLSAVFSTVGVVPFSIAAGFVRMTGQYRMTPFFISCLALIAVSLFPAAYSVLALLPEPVAYAAMLAAFTQMVGIGLSSVLKETLDQRRLTIVGIALSLGTGSMFVPKIVFYELPTVLQYVLSNGVMVGMLTALILEHCWRPVKEKTVDKGRVRLIPLNQSQFNRDSNL
ncbi:purine/pyrimidine permease [Metabacillus fastidiosus]|uniref:purine/pyrimidine permease n=1 Tax=Metabacillus fastidiosus TaxID=1458 RepID=UPI0009EE5EC8|nr:purine/pyrimidine permease [Metabacillus fastidiosus]MED4462303.1 purine/pyrimidine permease [Metabacillus fastidiosus]